MNATTTSKWGGYGASFFSIVSFGEGIAFAVTQGDLPAWFAVVTGATFSLAVLCGTICLAAALLDYFRHRRSGIRPAGGEVAVSSV